MSICVIMGFVSCGILKRLFMSAAFSKALDSIKNLSNDEKALMAHCLISDLDSKLDNDVEKAWAQLAQKRFEELKSSKVKSVSWNEIKKTIVV